MTSKDKEVKSRTKTAQMLGTDRYVARCCLVGSNSPKDSNFQVPASKWCREMS